ncbi:MAG: ORF6N domain-containing protein [Candidatus Omnitrophota bacterium]
MSSEIIEQEIYIIRGHKVMIDFDLAKLYKVEVKQLKRSVRRNIERFPLDFMFELTKEETAVLRSQIGTSKRGQHAKYLSFAFTEQGVAMLSSILNSKRAIQVNIAIMRTFAKLREMIATHKDLKQKLKEMEKKYDKQFQIVFQALEQLLEEPESKPKKQIGFH